MNKGSENQISPLKWGVYLCFQKSILYMYDVWQIRQFCYLNYASLLVSFSFLMFVSFGSTTYFHPGDIASKLATEELGWSSLMVSVVSPPSDPVPPARERHRAAATLPVFTCS